MKEDYDVDLVNDTGAYDCLVCHLIPRDLDPTQVSSFVKRFCRECVTRVLSEMNACPSCQAKGDTVNVFEDEGQRQAVLELKVYCPNKKQGCDWTCELRHLDTHLNSDPIKDSHEGCQWPSTFNLPVSTVLSIFHATTCAAAHFNSMPVSSAISPFHTET